MIRTKFNIKAVEKALFEIDISIEMDCFKSTTRGLNLSESDQQNFEGFLTGFNSKENSFIVVV